MGEYTPLCTDGDKLARLIVRHGFREGVIKMAAEYQAPVCASPYGEKLYDPSMEGFTSQQRCHIRAVVVEELKNLKLKIA